MAVAINRTTLEYRPSEDPNTLSGDDWLLLGLKAPARVPTEDEQRVIAQVPSHYWVIDADVLREMTTDEKAVVDAGIIAATKAQRKAELLADTEAMIASRYPDAIREQLMSMFTRSALAGLANRAAYIGALAAWADAASLAWATACAYVDAAESLEAIAAVQVDGSFLASDPGVTIAAAVLIED